MGVGGHFWTLMPKMADALAPARAPVSEPWSVRLEDPSAGLITLTGRLRRPKGARGLLIVVHGLGGSCQSPYARRAARAAQAAGLACLRLNLRGADRRGDDFYHAALTKDLAAAIASDEAAGFGEIYVLGYSLGGHMALRYAALSPDRRLKAVAAVCAPLDLDACATSLDRPRVWPYRTYILKGLLSIYEAVAVRRPVPIPAAEARRIRGIREWDRLIVAPRHGFAGAEDYYARASAGPHLGGLAVPALMVASEEDPMVPAASLQPFLKPAPSSLTVRWVRRGGHVGFPGALNLGFPGSCGLEAQCLAFLRSRD